MSWFRLPGLLRVTSAATVVSFVFFLPPINPAQEPSELGSGAQARIERTLRSFASGRWIGQVAISPDGARLAWVEGGIGGERIRTAGFGHLAEAQTIATPEGSEECDQNDLAWAPDSRQLVFLSDCGSDGQDNLYLWSAQGGTVRQLTDLRGFVHGLAFSPDGQRIGFLYVPGATRPAGALAAQDPAEGVIGQGKPEVQRVAFANANARQPQEPVLASPPDLYVYEFDWSPDSRLLAYVAADPPGENNWWVARLYTQMAPPSPAAGGASPPAKPQLLLAPAKVPGALHGLQIAVPRWSPDSKEIAFIGGLMSDQGVTGGDVWIVPSGGGVPRDLTPNRRSTPSWITWDGDRRLFVTEVAGGEVRLFPLDLKTNSGGMVSAVAGKAWFAFAGRVGDGRLERSLSATRDRSRFVFVASTFERGPEIYAASAPRHDRDEMNGAVQLSHLNQNDKTVAGRTVSLEWTNEGFHVQGWLLLPADYDPAKKYPLIVEVHGGPASAMLPSWDAGGSLSPPVFSALGYFVLLPNPRGSFGQGEAFTQANRKGFGYGDLRDILAGVDTVLKKYPVDPSRVGITGWSYGGFMTMFAVTQTQRFRAAVAGAGISDWLSYYGENSIDQWMIPYFGTSVYEDPLAYARSSPIDFIKHAHTPTLIVVGDRDGECPAPQSFEFWHALRDLHVPTQLVVYPNEGHGFVNPQHRVDVLERAAGWFARYMPEEQGVGSRK